MFCRKMFSTYENSRLKMFHENLIKHAFFIFTVEETGKVQSTPDNSNPLGKSKTVRVIENCFWNKFNISDFSALFFFRLVTRLKHGSSNRGKWSEGKQKSLPVNGRFKFLRVRATEGKISLNVCVKNRKIVII